jgi:hypothetical protein
MGVFFELAVSEIGVCPQHGHFIPFHGEMMINHVWLVVEPTPLKNDGVRQLA